MGWADNPQDMRNHQVTVHGLDIGIRADMTVSSSLSALTTIPGAWEREEDTC